MYFLLALPPPPLFISQVLPSVILKPNYGTYCSTVRVYKQIFLSQSVHLQRSSGKDHTELVLKKQYKKVNIIVKQTLNSDKKKIEIMKQ